VVAKRIKGLLQPPTEADLPETGKTDSSAWSYLKSEDNGQYRFPRLLIFLELLDKKDGESLDKTKIPNTSLHGTQIPNTHVEGFSDPIRCTMNLIDQSQRVTASQAPL
jgi:hypothetical protein